MSTEKSVEVTVTTVEEPAKTVNAPKATAKKVVKKEVVEVVQSDDSDDDLTACFDNAISANNKRGKRFNTSRGLEITDPPIVRIGTEEIKLEEITFQEFEKTCPRNSSQEGLFYGRMAPDFSNANYGIEEYYPNKDKLKHYRFIHNGITVCITSGSKLIVREEMKKHQWGWQDEDDKKNNPVMIIVASSIECEKLYSPDKIYVMNSRLIFKEAVTLQTVDIVNSWSAGKILSMEKSNLESSRLEGSDFISLNDSRLQKIKLSGFKSVHITKVMSYAYSTRDVGFNLSIIGYKPGFDLEIKDVSLGDFDAGIFTYNKYSIVENTERPWVTPTIEIKRRIDYGYFSGKTSVPFVKIKDYGIMVDGEVFTYSEFFATGKLETDPYPKGFVPESQANPTPGYLPPPSFNPYSLSGKPSYINDHFFGSRGVTFNRAVKIISGNRNTENAPVGGLITNLGETLIEQIKSRLNVINELESLSSL